MLHPPRTLWFLPKWPLPAQDGARVANVNLLKGLTSLGEKIDVLCIAGADEQCDADELKRVCGIADCFIVRKKRAAARKSVKGVVEALCSLFVRPWLAVTLAPFAASGVCRGVREIFEHGPHVGGHWATLVYDGLHPAAHASSRGLYRVPLASASHPVRVIYRAHNVESEIWRRKTALTKFFISRLFFSAQTFLMKRFEDSLVGKADAVMAVSETDWALFRESVPGARGGVVPIGYDFSETPAPPPSAERALFLGRLDWPPNRDGLTWFLEEVWPEAYRRNPALELWIAGSGKSEWLKKYLAAPGVRFLGRVGKLDEIYRDCALSLVPVFYGSGTRVKAIEASRYGRGCLSTEIGVEGLGLEEGKTFIRAETAAEWIEALARLNVKEAAQIGSMAHARLKESFHLPAAAKKFLTLSSSIERRHPR